MNPITLELPDFALVVLIGASGSGKSSFAAKHFLPTEVLSSDYFRALVSDDETSMEATNDAFEALHYLAGVRLRRRNLTVIDATNVQEASRRPLLELARKYHAVPVVIALDVPERVCHERNQIRPNRDFGPHVVRRHVMELRRSLRGLKREGFRYVYPLVGVERIETVAFERTPLWNDKRGVTGPFDIIGDVHGCYDELTDLLTRLEYAPDAGGVWRHAAGRRLIFLGDLVDRGLKTVETCRLVMDAVGAGAAFCVPGNHDEKLKRALEGKDVRISHGLKESLDQIALLPDDERTAFSAQFVAFAENLIGHLWLDGGALVVAHAGMPENMQGRASGQVRQFALYGETTGETDEFGLPVRWNWAAEYRGKAAVVYGHTPTPKAEWLNNTMDIDTGCVFGGALSALRWPEKQLVAVPARAVYAEPLRPLVTVTDAVSEQWRNDDILDLADFTGRRVVETRLAGNVLVAAENGAAALEVMSRFAAHPRWLCYLPPTMSPVETSPLDDFLEHPAQAFSYFARCGVETVVCQEKHMGSRSVLIVCRDANVARVRFGAEDDAIGIVLTRTGRPFFDDAARMRFVVGETARAIEAAGLWDELETDWIVLDAELMPWNAKAQGLLKEQYAPVAAAGLQTLTAEVIAWEAALVRGVPGAGEQAARAAVRLSELINYADAYARYCWPVNEVTDLKIAPFHVLAAEGKTFLEKNHEWHIGTLARLAAQSALFHATDARTVSLGEEAARQAATDWWQAKTEAGSEGMVVKPLDFLPPAKCQPAVKVRGREYLRIIYGPEYLAPENLPRLKQRSVGGKRALAAKEFALGVEGLERFVRRDPLRRVHECAFAVLALESEPVDPRL